MIKEIIETVKFCKKMGIAYVEFNEDTNIEITQGEELLLKEFQKYNKCTIMVKENEVQYIDPRMNCCITPMKYKLVIYIDKED